VSKRTRERDFASDLNDSEFERALEETEHRKTDRGRRLEQKTRQLCQQARRALNLALAAHSADGALDGVFVIEVSAAAGCGRLVAHVAVPGGHSVADALEELRERAPQLRSVVAGYISRKRAPELSFVVAPLGGDSYE
jgi:ribosome-binding factor A